MFPFDRAAAGRRPVEEAGAAAGIRRADGGAPSLEGGGAASPAAGR